LNSATTTPDMETDEGRAVQGTLDPLVVPCRFRLSASCFLLAVVALVDPGYVASLIGLGIAERRKIEKRRTAEKLCGHNAQADRPAEAGEGGYKWLKR
jgi:hypothetical protein